MEIKMMKKKQIRSLGVEERISIIMQIMQILRFNLSDEELPKEEEAEVLRIQREKAKSLSMADLGLQDSDEDESDSDKQTQDGLQDEKSKGKRRRDTLDASYEEIKKDIGALSKEE
ncbi:something about silencing protein 10 [Carex littledalei]|uniref:Something about silencing protein 10 n=1 Tax=Carex littledalei TaxID=544730 RepID=A0A833QZF1_9POAL|nr:something about silencing protein 10 [Carex littledalei]